MAPGETGDAAALVLLAAACFSEAWAAADFRKALEDEPRTRVFVARRAPLGHGVAERTAIAGYVVSRIAIDEMEILDLAVDASARRAGLGRQLIRTTLAAGEGRGVRVAYLEVRESNTAARSLYDTLGFRERGRRRSYYRNPPEDAIILRLDAPFPIRP